MTEKIMDYPPSLIEVLAMLFSGILAMVVFVPLKIADLVFDLDWVC